MSTEQSNTPEYFSEYLKGGIDANAVNIFLALKAQVEAADKKVSSQCASLRPRHTILMMLLLLMLLMLGGALVCHQVAQWNARRDHDQGAAPGFCLQVR